MNRKTAPVSTSTLRRRARVDLDKRLGHIRDDCTIGVTKTGQARYDHSVTIGVNDPMDNSDHSDFEDMDTDPGSFYVDYVDGDENIFDSD